MEGGKNQYAQGPHQRVVLKFGVGVLKVEVGPQDLAGHPSDSGNLWGL
jgi:hypothetical protein